MEKEMKVIPPERYEIDKENSTFGCIKFKPIKKDLTYDDIAHNIFSKTDDLFQISTQGIIEEAYNFFYHYPTLSLSKKQLKKVLAINQLFNIAKYYNGDWEPDNLNEDYGSQYIIEYVKGEYKSIGCSAARCGMPAFKNVKVADAVINNPNFRDILDAIFK